MTDRSGKGKGQGTLAGTYFQYHIRGLKSGAADDPFYDPTVNKKMLAKPFIGSKSYPLFYRSGTGQFLRSFLELRQILMDLNTLRKMK